MRNSRRIKRMSRNRVKITKMNLTSLMDVFTILVFFLLINSGSVELVESPKDVTLPESFEESKPRETVVISVSPENVIVQDTSSRMSQTFSTTKRLHLTRWPYDWLNSRRTSLARRPWLSPRLRKSRSWPTKTYPSLLCAGSCRRVRVKATRTYRWRSSRNRRRSQPTSLQGRRNHGGHRSP